MEKFSNTQIWLVACASLICLLILINLVYSIFYFRRFSLALKILVPYFALSLWCESVSIYKFINLESTLKVINIYTIGEFFFVASFIGLLVNRKVHARNLFLGAVAVVTMVSGFYLLLSGQENVSLSYSETIENLVLMGLCVYYFIYTLNDKLNCKPEENILVKWIIIAHFVYLSGIILFWLSFDFLKTEFSEIIDFIVFFNAFLNLAFKFTILVSLLAYDHRIRRTEMLST